MLDVELGRLLGEFAGLEAAQRLGLVLQEAAGAGVDEAAHRDDREALVKLDGGQRVAGVGAHEGLLEVGVGDAFARGGEAGAELGAGGPHLQIGQDGLAAPQAAGDEYRHLLDMRQDFLRQHGERDRADMAAGLTALDHDGVGAGADQTFGQHQGRGEGDQLRAAVLDRAHRAAGRNAAGQHHMAHPGGGANAHQVVELRVHGDEVDAERQAGHRLGGGDLLFQQLRPHRAAGDDAEAAGIGDGGDQMALADPAHRAAHDGDARAQEGTAARPQPVQLGAGRFHLGGLGGDIRHPGHRRCAARAPPVPCIPRRSAPRP